ncbi:MAG: permease-like cell division protein FtsX, partial [Acidobacteria bacterium]|nr:permease-like cell division protein FtsX [Acidobacteriota bacterium]
FSVMIICLTFLTLGIFLALSNNIKFLTRSVSDDQVIVFFLSETSSMETVAAIQKEMEDSRLFSRIRLVNREEALAAFKTKFPDLESVLQNLNRNPFPSSLEATFSRDSLNTAAGRDLVERMRTREGISDIQYNREWIERMRTFDRLIRAVGFFLGGILIFASFFIISNVIKLNVLARKNEIAILRLVGATNWFIRIPFVMEGVFLGLLGGVLAVFLLWLVTALFPLYLGSSPGVIGELIQFRFLSVSQILALLVSGSLIGFLGSFSSLSKFLKI